MQSVANAFAPMMDITRNIAASTQVFSRALQEKDAKHTDDMKMMMAALREEMHQASDRLLAAVDKERAEAKAQLEKERTDARVQLDKERAAHEQERTQLTREIAELSKMHNQQLLELLKTQAAFGGKQI